MKMEAMMMKETSRWWWFDSHNSSKRSPWLQSTLSELDAKTKAMLKLIEQDADSFAQRAEMYYRRRPELISMIEDFYRSHHSLAERYDQVRSDNGICRLTTLASPFSSNKYNTEKSAFPIYQPKYDSCSETCETEEYAESEVENPEHENMLNDGKGSESGKDLESDNESGLDEETEENLVCDLVGSQAGNGDEVVKLREEIERLKEESRVQKEELMRKDEEKREVIRQLSMAIEMLKEDNLELKKRVAVVAKEETPKKLWSPMFEFKKLKDGFLRKSVNASQKIE